MRSNATSNRATNSIQTINMSSKDQRTMLCKGKGSNNKQKQMFSKYAETVREISKPGYGNFESLSHIKGFPEYIFAI